MKNKKHRPEISLFQEHFSKYLFFGGIAALVDFSSFTLLTTVTHTIFVSNIGATILGAVTNYTLNRKRNFYYTQPYKHNTLFRGAIVFFVSLLMNSVLLWLFLHIMSTLIAKTTVIASMVIINFLMNKHYVFTAHTSP